MPTSTAPSASRTTTRRARWRAAPRSARWFCSRTTANSPSAWGRPVHASQIAVIGPNAAVARLGGYYGQPPVTVSILDGIRARAAGKAEIVYAEGVKITANDDWWADAVKLADPDANRQLMAEAVEAARRADHVVLAIG